jgi:hypothetical protein
MMTTSESRHDGDNRIANNADNLIRQVLKSPLRGQSETNAGSRDTLGALTVGDDDDSDHDADNLNQDMMMMTTMLTTPIPSTPRS